MRSADEHHDFDLQLLSWLMVLVGLDVLVGISRYFSLMGLNCVVVILEVCTWWDLDANRIWKQWDTL